jgi:hypothetical protein
MDHSVSSFLSGHAISMGSPPAALLFAAKQIDQFAEEDVANSSFFLLDNGQWGKYVTNVAWPAIALAAARPSGQPGIAVAVSPYGDYWEVQPAGPTESVGKIGPDPVQLRALATIDNVVYACGMGRVVLKRDGVGQWRSVGPPAPPADDDSVIGFERLDGFSSRELYAVGWQGEIWSFNKTRWRRIDSPVSTKLNAVCCGEDKHVYAVGDNGVMLRGRNDVWTILNTGRDENLMDVKVHDGTVYVVTDFRILKLAGMALVDDAAFADAKDRPETCLYLLLTQGALFSMGPKDLFRLDAGLWQRLV